MDCGSDASNQTDSNEAARQGERQREEEGTSSYCDWMVVNRNHHRTARAAGGISGTLTKISKPDAIGGDRPESQSQSTRETTMKGLRRESSATAKSMAKDAPGSLAVNLGKTAQGSRFSQLQILQKWK